MIRCVCPWLSTRPPGNRESESQGLRLCVSAPGTLDSRAPEASLSHTEEGAPSHPACFLLRS